jgi:pimeloyl-ACP methyl ester carboxylesterase
VSRARAAGWLAAIIVMSSALPPVGLDTAATAAAAAAEPCATSQVQPVPGSASSLRGSVPVIFIHGIISSAAMWHVSSPGSIAGQAARLPGVTAWTFNYGRESLDWVTNQAIGPAFATAISCLAHASGTKVIIVAHSMGGLAAQFALGQPDHYGGTVAARVAELITIGTPYQGSELLSAAQWLRHHNGIRFLDGGEYPLAFWAAAEALLSACAGATSGPCAVLNILPSQVGTDLEEGSPAISDLPAWPPGLPILDIAGDMRIQLGIDLLKIDVNFGDPLVTVGSATARNTVGTPYIKYCSAARLLLAVVAQPGPCYHTHLPNDADIITEVVDAIRSAASGQTIACGIVPAGPQGNLEVTIIKGPVSCVTARTVVDTYLKHPPEPPQGSGGFVQVGTWGCSAEDGYMFAKTGHAGNCVGSQGNISIDKLGATPRSCVAIFLPWNC